MKNEEEKKKKKRTEQPTQKKNKKKKSQKWSKVVVGTVCGSLVCLITTMPLSYELWKLKIAKMCF